MGIGGKSVSLSCRTLPPAHGRAVERSFQPVALSRLLKLGLPLSSLGCVESHADANAIPGTQVTLDEALFLPAPAIGIGCGRRIGEFVGPAIMRKAPSFRR
jgi:hypothetical protein